MLAAVLLSSLGEALAAKAMKEVDTQQLLVEQLKVALSDWHVWVGFGLLLAYVLLYIYALSLAQLSVVLPLSAASYLIGLALSKYYLHEEIKPARVIGTLIIVAGVMVIAWSGFADEKGGGADG